MFDTLTEKFWVGEILEVSHTLAVILSRTLRAIH